MLVPPDELEREAAELRAKLSEAELGYLVGLIEGEGGFIVLFNKRTGRYYPRIKIGNTNFELLCFLKNKLNVGYLCSTSVRGNRKESYEWNINGREALVLIEAVFNYIFSCKKIKAALLLSLNRENKGYYAEAIYKQIKKLNSREEELDLQPKKTSDCCLKNLTQFQLGLIAGLVDGEGAICIQRERGMYLGIANTCPRLILTLLKIIRGCGLTAYYHHHGWRKLYFIRLHNQKATALLEIIKELLFIKQRQAYLALEWARTLGQRRRPLSPEIRKKRMDLYWRMRTLNKRGRAYSA